jgi:hypothetical protein
VNVDSIDHLRDEIARSVSRDAVVLNQLRDEIRPFRGLTRQIQPRSTTAISLVAADGGNNRLEFDPFLVQLVRVVDSSNNELCLEAITPTTNVRDLSRRQFDAVGQPTTPLGEMMDFLGCADLAALSPMIRHNDERRPVSPSWVQVYRELVEWAILFWLVRNRSYGTDTLIVYDGLLRSKVFTGDLFHRYIEGFNEAIQAIHQRERRRIYVVGMAKHSKVLDRYRLAMALEGVLRVDYPAFVEVPREVEEKAYVWSEYARGNDVEGNGEINKFVGGKMFFVKFGRSPHDPIWPVDIFSYQSNEAQTVLGYMLADAINGFPVPFYPQCLQRAHENAALVDFDFDVLQDYIITGIRDLLGADGRLMDIMRLQDADPSLRRYD